MRKLVRCGVFLAAAAALFGQPAGATPSPAHAGFGTGIDASGTKVTIVAYTYPAPGTGAALITLPGQTVPIRVAFDCVQVENILVLGHMLYASGVTTAGARYYIRVEDTGPPYSTPTDRSGVATHSTTTAHCGADAVPITNIVPATLWPTDIGFTIGP